MNKQNLVEAVVKKTGQSKETVQGILEEALEVIQEAVASGDDVTLMGFGTFLPGTRKASKGFNPHTGKKIDLPAMKLPKFRAGKGFKERMK